MTRAIWLLVTMMIPFAASAGSFDSNIGTRLNNPMDAFY
jgi:hypothetical protein